MLILIYSNLNTLAWLKTIDHIGNESTIIMQNKTVAVNFVSFGT